jgi:AbrB family looped-hinge helix DNA binding protein
MTVKGQVTIPKALRDAFGWRVGDEVAFLREEDGVKIVGAARRRKGRALVERLERVRWNPRMSTERLMTMTRGRDG